MNNDDANMLLTSDELMHMAIEASDRERYDLSIAYLKQALGKASPPAAEIPFLLGAQYAQIKMYGDAEHWMTEAVALNPTFDIALFQLGLLQLTGGKLEAARQTWDKLDFLPSGHAIRLFRDGLLALNQEHLPEAAELLRQGLAAGSENAPLLGEMRRVLANVEQMQHMADGVPSATAEGSSEHLFINAYKS